MIQPGIYEHFKGNRYRVIGHGLYEPNEEPVVVYEALYDNEKSKLWVRPVASFVAQVIVDGELQPRFRLISITENGS